MTVRELRELLAAYPDYWEVMAGPRFVSDVREVTRVGSERESHGGRADFASVVVVIE